MFHKIKLSFKIRGSPSVDRKRYCVSKTVITSPKLFTHYASSILNFGIQPKEETQRGDFIQRMRRRRMYYYEVINSKAMIIIPRHFFQFKKNFCHNNSKTTVIIILFAQCAHNNMCSGDSLFAGGNRLLYNSGGENNRGTRSSFRETAKQMHEVKFGLEWLLEGEFGYKTENRRG